MTLPIPARSGGIRPEGLHIFIEPQQGATQGQLLDEFQRAYEIAPGIADVMKAAVDDAPRPSLTFSGSRRHLMEQMVQDPDHGPLHNVGAKLYLGRVPAADFSRFLRSRAEPERIYQLALGVLKDVQLLGPRATGRGDHRGSPGGSSEVGDR
ncbi:MAG: hypothetical protein M0T72_08795 [Candidatus Dormibacteraeota bacterium]|nr:hypothetical protein [Candidatus Dormibacteraeota bacterium]